MYYIFIYTYCCYGILARLYIIVWLKMLFQVLFEIDKQKLTAILSHEEITNVCYESRWTPWFWGFLLPKISDLFWKMLFAFLCCSFFNSDRMLPNWNCNSIVLISKIPEASRVDQLHSISLANFKFKIITKILVDRLACIAIIFSEVFLHLFTEACLVLLMAL